MRRHWGIGKGSHVIRIDAEVKAVLDRERRPGERNYNAAIKRLMARNAERRQV